MGIVIEKKIMSNLANKDKVNLAFKAAMVSLSTKKDYYSNGGYFWQGADFKNKGSAAHEGFYTVGFRFSDKSHDIYGMGSFTRAGRVAFKYESTAAAAGTIFMRLTEDWKKANGSTRWDGR